MQKIGKASDKKTWKLAPYQGLKKRGPTGAFSDVGRKKIRKKGHWADMNQGKKSQKEERRGRSHFGPDRREKKRFGRGKKRQMEDTKGVLGFRPAVTG